MMGILRKEISSMNYEQSKRFDLEKKEILTYYTSTLKPFLIPGIITFMTLLLILLATLLGMSMINPDFKWYEKAWIATEFGSAYLIILLIYVLVSMLFDKNLKIKRKLDLYYFYYSDLHLYFVYRLSFYNLFFMLIYFVFLRFPKMQRITEQSEE